MVTPVPGNGINTNTSFGLRKGARLLDPNQLRQVDTVMEYLRTYADKVKTKQRYGILPFALIMNSEIDNWLRFLIEVMPKDFYKTLDKSFTSESALYHEFFQRFIDYKESGDAEPLHALINKTVREVRESKSDKFLFEYCNVIGHMTSMLKMLEDKNFNKDFLLETPLSLFPEIKLHPSEYPTVAANVYVALFKGLLEESSAIESGRYITEEGDLIFQQVIDTFNSKLSLCLQGKSISKDLKNSLSLYWRTIVKDFNKTKKVEDKIISEYFKSWTRDYESIYSDVCNSQNNPVPAFLNNRKQWEAFLPLVIEFREIADGIFQGFDRFSDTLKYFPLYLHFGDLSRLDERIKSDPTTSRSAIISEEIQKFIQSLDTNKKQQLEVLKFLADPNNDSTQVLYKSVIAKKRQLSEFQSHTHWYLDAAIDLAKEWSPHLFKEVAPHIEVMPDTYEEKGRAPKTVRPAKVTKPHHRKVKNQEALTVTEAVQDSDEETDTPAKVSTKVVCTTKLPEIFTIEQRLQTLKTKMTSSLDLFRNTKKCSECFGVTEALTNSEVHWECLLSSMKRLIESKGTTSNAELFNLVIDIVRDSALAIEQSMNALDMKSNHVKDKATHKKLLTHNLLQKLWSCKFKHGVLPPQFRIWIRQMNYGEILSRDLRDCKINGTYVEALLTKARLIAANSTAFSQKEVISHAVEYFKRAGLICFEFQKEMLGNHERVAPLEKSFLEFCREVDKHFATESTPVERPLGNDLKGIITPIADFRRAIRNKEIQGGLDNVLNNLCLQLQVEMDLHASLEPVDAYRHMSKIILLNQMIAEQYLLNLHDALGIAYDLDAIDHDLATLITSLGMKQTDFSPAEWEFLSCGKALRLLVRYPESYADIYEKKKGGPVNSSLEKAVRDALAFTQSQIFQKGNITEGGFTVASPKLDAIKGVVEEDLRLLSSILGKIAQRTQRELGLEESDSK